MDCMDEMDVMDGLMDGWMEMMDVMDGCDRWT